MSKLVIETIIRIDQQTIEVTASTRLRKWAKDERKFFKAKDVIPLLEGYQVTEVLEDKTIANTARGNHKQRATWFFRVKKREFEKPTLEKKEEPKTSKPQQEKKPAPQKKPPAPTPAKKTSTKTSIRGRMSKIAQKKQENNEQK